MPSSYTPAIATPITPPNGGTGVANNAASTLTISGNFGTTFTVSGATALTLPTTGTVATLTTFGAPPAIGNVTPAAISGTVITATTAFGAADGSVTVPTIYRTADSTTGISFSSSQVINFITGGDRKFSVQGDNLVGFGNSFGSFIAPASGGFQVNGRDVNLTAPGAYWVISAASAERLRISTAVIVASGTNFQLGNAAATGLVAGALAALTTASIVIYDSTGTAYRVPCITP